MRIVVDLNRCPRVCAVRAAGSGGAQASAERRRLTYDPNPDDQSAPAGVAGRGVMPGAGDHRRPVRPSRRRRAREQPSATTAASSSSGPRSPGFAPPRRCAKRASAGGLTVIGDEQARGRMTGRRCQAGARRLGWRADAYQAAAHARDVDAEWRLGVAATRSGPSQRVCAPRRRQRGRGRSLLIATGVRSRKWPNPDEAALEGVLHPAHRAPMRAAAGRAGRRTAACADHRLRLHRLEVASVCRDLGLDVTVAERGPAPAVRSARRSDRRHRRRDAARGRVDLRTGVSVLAMEGDAGGHVRRARLSDGSTPRRRCGGHLAGARSAISSGSTAPGWPPGLWVWAATPGCRAFERQRRGHQTHLRGRRHRPLPPCALRLPVSGHGALGQRGAGRPGRRPTTWCAMRRTAAPHLLIRQFWSGQFGVNIKSVGVPRSVTKPCSPRVRSSSAGSRRRPTGRRGRIVGAVTFNHGKWIPYYEAQIARSAPFPRIRPVLISRRTCA